MLENPHLAQEQSFEVNELSDDIKKDGIVTELGHCKYKIENV